MDLQEKTIKICEDLSKKLNYPLKPTLVKDSMIYYGFKSKKGFYIFEDAPIFSLGLNYGVIALTSYYRQNDGLVKEIAKANDIYFQMAEHNQFTVFWHSK